MANKNNKDGVASRNTSQFDSQQTLRLGFDDDLQSFRFHDSQFATYDRFETELDSSGNITKIRYYTADTRERFEITCTGDTSGSLNNTHFIVNSAYDQLQYYIWYNVAGGGTDPAIAGAIGIEVPIVTDESATIVAMATKSYMLLNDDLQHLFSIRQDGAVLYIDTNQKGPVENNSVGTSGFTLNTVEDGSETLTDIYCITYSGCDVTGMYKL